MTAGERADFFVQEEPKGAWHCESREDCEAMLCGVRVSVDAPYVRIKTSVPSRALACADCFIRWQKRAREESR